MRLSKRLFHILILLLPLNLGKHFEVLGSYVWGILSDYLVPVLYVQDLLMVGIVLLWFYENGIPSRDKVSRFVNSRVNQLIILFIFAVGFSVAGSDRALPSAAIFVRLVLCTLLFFYVRYEIEPEKDFPTVVKILALDTALLSGLALLQFIKQGAVFNNYLFFGEQPYSVSTWGINREMIFGSLKVPAYGVFRHPNIFGGFLSIILIWILERIKTNRFYVIAFLAGLLGLFLTFSYVAWAGFITGLLSYLYIRFYEKEPLENRKKKIVLVFLAMFLLINLIVPTLVNFQPHSLYRRASLSLLSIKMSADNPLFGVGPGGFVAGLGDIKFTQPVHNIFLLIFSECGVFSFLLFLSVFATVIKKLTNPSYFFVFLISALQIMFMGSLDHYFWTIHQTLILMFLVLAFSFTNADGDAS